MTDLWGVEFLGRNYRLQPSDRLRGFRKPFSRKSIGPGELVSAEKFACPFIRQDVLFGNFQVLVNQFALKYLRISQCFSQVIWKLGLEVFRRQKCSLVGQILRNTLVALERFKVFRELCTDIAKTLCCTCYVLKKCALFRYTPLMKRPTTDMLRCYSCCSALVPSWTHRRTTEIHLYFWLFLPSNR